ncbi:type II 3-dehydroquinate dehydratase [Melittangium boletus]|uniref:type II 3-dehydroquinate dehydratase n=1 Tax=Melittangium boletus TaxID=83453 RepID=UPI003DA58965
MGKRLLVLHGPNLNLVAGLDAAVKARAAELGLELTVVQSNHEGVLLDTLHAERSRVQGVVVSPAGLFGSYPLRDGLEAVGLPALEVYVSPLGERVSVVAEACADTLESEGPDAYLEALTRFANDDLTGENGEDADEEDADEEDADEEDDDVVVGPGKTLGRKPKAAAAPAAPGPGSRKTLGRKVAEAPAPAASSSKTLGRKPKGTSEALSEDVVSRALVHKKISDRLAGRLSPAELAAWARTRWLEVQGGGPTESGQRDLLEETLQRLTLSNIPASRLSERELVDLMTRMDR